MPDSAAMRVLAARRWSRRTSLSSIEPNTTASGYLAAQLLDLMMQGLSLEPGLRLIEPTRIVARQSSGIVAVDDPLVSETLRFTRARSDQNLAVSAVLRHVGLSRRALDLRFDATLGRTVHGEIIRVRMDTSPSCSPRRTGPCSRSRSGSTSATPNTWASHSKHTGQSPGQYRRTVNGPVAAKRSGRRRSTRQTSPSCLMSGKPPSIVDLTV